MNILLTGATGFVGQNFLKYFVVHNESDHIYAVTRSKRETDSKRITWIMHSEYTASILDSYKIDAIIHLAGKAHDTQNTTESEEYYKVNFELTKQIFDAFIGSNASTFIFLSTIKAVGDDKTYVHNAEDLGEPTTPYAKTKREAEKYIQNYPLPSTKRHYILRPCLIYGPDVKGNLAELVKYIEKETPYPLAAFHNKRSYLSVENLSHIFLKLLEQKRPSFTLNISNEDAISTVELIEIIAQKLQKKARTFSIPESIVRLLAKMGDKFSFIPLNSEKLKKLTDSFVVDTGEMNKKLGFELPHKTRENISSIVDE